jgi:hypothetical protein
LGDKFELPADIDNAKFHSIQGNPSISKKEPDGGSTLPI